MAKVPNHICAICGTKYYACDQCPDVKGVTPWRTICDTESHYRIFNTIVMMNNHVISEEKAKELLEEMDLQSSDIDGVLPEIKNIITSLLQDGSTKNKLLDKKNKMKR